MINLDGTKTKNNFRNKPDQILTDLMAASSNHIKNMIRDNKKHLIMFVSNKAYLELRFKKTFMGVKQKNLVVRPRDYMVLIGGVKVIKIDGSDYFDQSITSAMIHY